jgi:hypothetical protein
VQRQERRGSPARRFALGTLTGVILAATLYGLHLSVSSFVAG